MLVHILYCDSYRLLGFTSYSYLHIITMLCYSGVSDTGTYCDALFSTDGRSGCSMGCLLVDVSSETRAIQNSHLKMRSSVEFTVNFWDVGQIVTVLLLL